MAGAAGMGVYSTLDELAALPRKVVTYRPRIAAEQVERLLAGWKRAVAQVLHGS
jgi:glycerol kinase